MTDFKEIILTHKLSALFSKASFGIEKESQRITGEGTIAEDKPSDNIRESQFPSLHPD